MRPETEFLSCRSSFSMQTDRIGFYCPLFVFRIALADAESQFNQRSLAFDGRNSSDKILCASFDYYLLSSAYFSIRFICMKRCERIDAPARAPTEQNRNKQCARSIVCRLMQRSVNEFELTQRGDRCQCVEAIPMRSFPKWNRTH